MGTGLPDDDDAAGLAAFVDELADVGSAGVVVELGRRWAAALPDALVDGLRAARPAAGRAGPGDPLRRARAGDRRARGRPPARRAARGAARARDLHRAQQRAWPARSRSSRPCSGSPTRPWSWRTPSTGRSTTSPDPTRTGGFLDGWPARSRRVEVAGRTGWDAANGWLVTRLGTADRAWGRLVIGSPQAPSQRLVAVAERAARPSRCTGCTTATAAPSCVARTSSCSPGWPRTPTPTTCCAAASWPASRCAAAASPALVVRPRVGSAAPADLDEVAATVVRAAHGAAAPGAGLRGRARPAGAGLAPPPARTPTTWSTGWPRACCRTTTSCSPPGRVVPDRTGDRPHGRPRPGRSPTPHRRRGASRTPTCTGSPTCTCAGCSRCSARTSGVRLFVERELAPLQAARPGRRVAHRAPRRPARAAAPPGQQDRGGRQPAPVAGRLLRPAGADRVGPRRRPRRPRRPGLAARRARGRRTVGRAAEVTTDRRARVPRRWGRCWT